MKKLLWLLFIPLIVFGIDGTNTKFATEVMEFFQISTPASPAATKNKLYFKSDDRLYKLNSSGSEEEIGAGGVGGVNYLADTNDSDFEIDVGNWVAFNDGAVDVPIDGTGGTAVLTCTRNTTTPIRLTGDLKLLAAASDMQGEGCSADFDIDKGMKAQKLTGLFWLDTSDANYADDDLAVFVYDRTNANIIRVNGEDIKGGSGKHYFQFQSASDSTSYRLIVMVQSTATLGYSTFFDQISVGPTNISKGAIKIYLGSYTPSIIGSVANPTKGTTTTDIAHYWRDGEHLIVQYNYTQTTGGSTGSGYHKYSLPDGLVISSKQQTGASGTKEVLEGAATILDDTNGIMTGIVGAEDSTHFYIMVSDNGVSPDFTGQTSGFANLGATSVNISASFTVAIEGWSSDAVMSSDLGGRDIVVSAKGSSAAAITANTEAVDFIEVKDTTSSWSQDGVHGKDTFTAPETGEYKIEGSLAVTAATIFGIASYIKPVGGSSTKDVRLGVSDGVNTTQTFAGTVSLNKGEELTIKITSTKTTVNSVNNHWIHIQKLASPQTVLETATTVLKVTDGSGQTVNSTQSTLTWDNVETDTHGNFSAGVYTIEENGTYVIQAKILSGSVTWSAGDTLDTVIYKNGSSQESVGFVRIAAAITSSFPSFVSDTLTLSKGDTIEVQARGSASSTLSPTDRYNTFSIIRIK